ncbi:MAG: YraN family protein [Chloroflexota bacterium]
MTKRPTTKRQLGDAGEELAVRALQARGLIIVARNYRCTAGEMDVIARDGDALVFVEVKTRRGDQFGTAAEAVNARKQQKLIDVAETYLQAKQLDDVDWRIDVVAVEMDARGKLLRVEVIENAVMR